MTFEKGKAITRPLMGVQILDLTNKYVLYRYGINVDKSISSGIILMSVSAGYPASDAGLKDGDVITNVSFLGGCNGNLKAVSKLVEGMTVEKIEGYLKGNTCGMRNTSCADQLALAVRTAYEEANK